MIRAALALVMLAMSVTTAIAQDDWIAPAGCDHPLAGKIWDVPQGAFVTEAELLGQLAVSTFVLLGEPTLTKITITSRRELLKA